jgi:hypothetical protein
MSWVAIRVASNLSEIVFRAAIVLLTVLIVPPARALNFECSRFQELGGALKRPSEPTCVDGLPLPREDNDDFAFQNCRSEIESYRGELNDYLSCLKSESDDVVRSFNDLVNRFNSMAR